MSKQDGKIRLKNIIGYGSTDLFGNGAMAVTGAWILYFYTTFCGLSPVQAGIIFAVARIVDGIFSPIMGYITDNFGQTTLGKRFGRRRFFILLGIPFAACYSFVFLPGMGFWYYLCTYLILEMTTALVMVPYDTLAAEMTNDFDIRSKLSGARMIFSQSATFIASFLPGRLMKVFGEHSADAFFYTGVVFSVIFVVVLLSVYVTTWEGKFAPVVAKQKLGALRQFKKIFVDLSSTLRIKTFRHHLIIYVSSFTSLDVFSAVFTYYIVFALQQNIVVSSNLLSVMSIFQVIAAIGCMWVIVKIGPSSSMKITAGLGILSVIGYVGIYFISPENLMTYLIGVSVIMGLVRGATNFIPWNVYSFIPDIDEMVTAKRREGIFAGVMTFTRKSTTALAMFIVGVILQVGGFTSNTAVQTPTAINTIIGLMFFGIIGLELITLIVAFRFKLSKKTHQIVIDEVERLKNGGSMDQVDPKTAEIVESLTGWQYKETWAHNNVGFKEVEEGMSLESIRHGLK